MLYFVVTLLYFTYAFFLYIVVDELYWKPKDEYTNIKAYTEHIRNIYESSTTAPLKAIPKNKIGFAKSV